MKFRISSNTGVRGNKSENKYENMSPNISYITEFILICKMVRISYERTVETMSKNSKKTQKSPGTSIFRINCVCVNIYMYVCTLKCIRPYVQGCENIHQPTDRICCRLDIRSAFPARWIGAVSKAIPQSFRGLKFTEFLDSRQK